MVSWASLLSNILQLTNGLKSIGCPMEQVVLEDSWILGRNWDVRRLVSFSNRSSSLCLLIFFDGVKLSSGLGLAVARVTLLAMFQSDLWILN